MTSLHGERAINTSAAGGPGQPTATIRHWTGWPPVPPGRRSPLCGDAAPSIVVFGQVKETGAAFPTGSALNNAKPVYEYFDGWKEDISDCRSFDELPEAAKKYIDFIEARIGVQIKYISVGAERDSIITRCVL